MNNKRILVTGGAGFMGSHIVDKLVETHNMVYAVDNFSGGFRRNVTKNLCGFFEVDLADPKETERMIRLIKPNIIFHLAASAREGASQFQPRHILQTNYQGFINLIVPAISCGMEKLILFSSMSVYGNQVSPFDEILPRSPVDIYAVNKAAMEHSTEILSDIYGFQYTIFRPHNVFGVRQCLRDKYRNVAAIFMNRIMREEPLYIYGDGNQTRSFSGIEYSLDCYIRALELETNQIINIGGQVPVSVNELATVVCEAMKVSPENYPRIYIKDRPLEVKHAFTTFKKSQDLLGYNEPVDGWINSVYKMAEWARTMGPKEWVSDGLELTSEKTPKTWEKGFVAPSIHQIQGYASKV